jgi:hypothetical protein
MNIICEKSCVFTTYIVKVEKQYTFDELLKVSLNFLYIGWVNPHIKKGTKNEVRFILDNSSCTENIKDSLLNFIKQNF